MARLLYKLGEMAYEKPKRILFAWIMIVVIGAIVTLNIGTKFSGSFIISGTESEKAGDVLKKAFSQDNETKDNETSTIRLIFKVKNGNTIETASAKKAINKTINKIKDNDKTVIMVSNLYTIGTISINKKIAYTDITYGVAADKVKEKSKENVINAIKITKGAGIETELGGSVALSELEIGGVSEVIGIIAAFLVLVVTFGLFLAAGLPIITALFGLVIGLMIIFIGSNLVDMSSFTLSLASMIGLAVGIDYALFIISRYRQNILEGYELREATASALATAGSAVLFAGITVIIALCGLSLVGVPFLGAMGIAASAVVLVVVLVSLTLVPAIIRLAGNRISPYKRSRIFKILEKKSMNSGEKKKSNADNKWGKLISRYPVITVIGVFVITIGLSVPALNLELGLPDNGMKSVDTTERRGYDILAEGFGDGFNGPLIVVADARKVKGDKIQAIQDSIKQLEGLSDIVTISDPISNQNGTIAMVNVIPESGPNDKDTKQLVENIRSKASKIEKDKKVELMVTGSTAVNIDISNKLSEAIPKFAAVIVGLAIILMILVFRSILVPIKAVIGFLMTLTSTLGFSVIVLQDGHFEKLFKLPATGPVLCFMPILATGILFGLAMDYEVFLVSRMREDFMKNKDAKNSVVSGINHSGRVVTAAGLIMIFVFSSFIFNEDIILKSMGISLAFGVLFDAFVVRMTFVPAIMTLLGKKAWYIPKWLDKVLPKFDIEDESLDHK